MFLYICSAKYNNIMSKISAYKKEDIVAAALELVRNGGEDALTARALGAAMGCSTSPLFTVCGSLEQIFGDVRQAAIDEFVAYVKDATNYIPAFKEYGLRLVNFAKTEPNLFKLVFMNTDAASERLNPIALECLGGMKGTFGLEENQVMILFDQMWTFACGLAMLEISGAENHTEQQISDMLSRAFAGTMMMLKSGMQVDNMTPRLRKEGEGSALALPEQDL